MIKRILLILLAVLFVLVLFNWELVVYGIRQGSGQLKIVWNARPIDEVLRDSVLVDSLKTKLLLVEDVREYAIDSLGLKDTENYKTVYDQKGKETLWVVTACEPFQLKAKEWKFPILGSVPYKGFFNEKLARDERTHLEAEGWDVSIRNPGGWSTLGWFTDPILSGMLNRDEGDLASLIIHEMVHSTIFVKDSVEFNENLASFIGDRGAEEFLAFRFGKESQELEQYIQADIEFLKYSDHMLRGCIYLDSIYTTIVNEPVERKKEIKEHAIRLIVLNIDSLSLNIIRRPSVSQNSPLPNNAYFMNFWRYQSKQDGLRNELAADFHGNLKEFIRYHAGIYPYL